MTETLLPGWKCPSCGGFTGTAKQEHTHCRACETPRPPVASDPLRVAARAALGALQTQLAHTEAMREAMLTLDRALDGESIPARNEVDVELAMQAFRLLLAHEWDGSEDRDLCQSCASTDGATHHEGCAWGDLCKLLRARGIGTRESRW